MTRRRTLRETHLAAQAENARVLQDALAAANVRHVWTGTRCVYPLRWDPEALYELPLPHPGGCAMLSLVADYQGIQLVLSDADDLCLQNFTSSIAELVTIFSELVAVEPVTMADVLPYLRD